MELNITNRFNPSLAKYYSASAHELGDDAGQITWQNAMDASSNEPLLTTPEALQAMRDHARSSGGWNDEEVAAWNDQELNALALQWLSGDIREGFDWPESERGDLTEWEFYEQLSEAGTVCGSLFRTDDGEIYWTFGE